MPKRRKLEWMFPGSHVGKQRYACPICDRRFKRLEVLESHRATVHGPTGQPNQIVYRIDFGPDSNVSLSDLLARLPGVGLDLPASPR